MNASGSELRLETLDRADWSVEVRGIHANEPLLSIGSSRALRTASVAKLFLLVEVASQFESGQLSPDELLSRDSVARVLDSGLWHRLSTSTLPASDIASLVGAVSDNWGTNVLLQRVGLDAVKARVASLGIVDSVLLDFVRDFRTDDDPETMSIGTAQEWARFIADAAIGAVVSHSVSGQLLEWMKANCDHSLVASAFGLDPLSHWTPDEGVMLWNKTGTDVGVRADVGLVQGVTQLAYAAIVNWDELRHPGLRPAIMSDLKRIGAWVSERSRQR
ncbi:MAG: serine hydrolase [Kineosporiaceae bacterium]|nr:serine hydrolase [Aeromicrobium sp.]